MNKKLIRKSSYSFKSRWSSSVFLILITVGIFSILFNSCRKPYESAEPQISKGDKINLGQGESLLPYRWISPYSIKTVRAVRAMAASGSDTLVHTKLLQPLKSQNYELYYKIIPNTPTKAELLGEWMDADSLNVAVTIPLDSIAMYPHLFSEQDLEDREDAKTLFYTTVPLNKPLPPSMGAVLIDTLYVPDTTERTLDFVLNLFTANLSDAFIQASQSENQGMHQLIMDIVDTNAFIAYQTINGEKKISGIWSDPNPGDPRWYPTYEFIKSSTYNGPDVGVGNGRTRGVMLSGGQITFEENTLGIQEGIRGLQVVAFRFSLLSGLKKYTTSTDVNGQFTSELPSWGFVTLDLRFVNDELKIRNLNWGDGIPTAVLSSLGHIMMLNAVANHFKIISPFSDINDIDVSFGHGTQQALWGITFNGVQEANDYAQTDGISGTSANPERFLNVLCFYNDITNSASAPMGGYIVSTGLIGLSNYVFYTLGLTSFFDNELTGTFPDMIISSEVDDLNDAHELRATIYHEYAHTRHYFKANEYSNAHWIGNITSTLATSGYGTDIDTMPGSFFALSEGWADFIGHNYAARKYPVFDELEEYNRWAFTWNTTSYAEHLEITPTYYNNFIPRGLFHDLIDNNTVQESSFDRIQGHTILQIYNLLNSGNYTIQQFREDWEDDYPSANNADLFDEYLER